MSPFLRNSFEVRKIAADLGLDCRGDPVRAILRHCEDQVSDVRHQFPHCVTPAQLLQALANKLGTRFAVVKSDVELRQLRKQQVDKGESGFATLELELEGKTYGITIRRLQRQMWEPEFISVIDCRGEKSHAENYTKWHEIGHLLILGDSTRSSFRRTHCSGPGLKPPEEALVDVIAGMFAFLPEMVQPHVDGSISFELIEEIRQKLSPEASRQSALIGIVRAWPTPCLLVRAELGLRKGEQRKLQQATFDFQQSPVPSLRAVRITASGAAKEEGFSIFPNMRVPTASVIHRVFESESGEAEAVENLDSWESREGGKLPPRRVTIKARYAFEGVDALVAPCARQ
jgi:hypothetical protein